MVSTQTMAGRKNSLWLSYKKVTTKTTKKKKISLQLNPKMWKTLHTQNWTKYELSIIPF